MQHPSRCECLKRHRKSLKLHESQDLAAQVLSAFGINCPQTNRMSPQSVYLAENSRQPRKWSFGWASSMYTLYNNVVEGNDRLSSASCNVTANNLAQAIQTSFFIKYAYLVSHFCTFVEEFLLKESRCERLTPVRAAKNADGHARL
jgi:hypothetical protein